jgi:hypothetical protein
VVPVSGRACGARHDWAGDHTEVIGSSCQALRKNEDMAQGGDGCHDARRPESYPQ